MMDSKDIDPNVWYDVGNGFSSCIKTDPTTGKWETWIVDGKDAQWRSAWNLPTEAAAADNLTGVIARTYGDERKTTAVREAP